MRPEVLVVHGAKSVDDVPGLAAVIDETELRLSSSQEELEAALPGAEALFDWSFRAAAVRAAFPKADRLRWIHWCGAGVDSLMFPELVRSDVVLTNTRGVFDRAMAEYALGLIIAMAKRMPESYRLQSKRVWDHRLGELIEGKQALVVGAGSIGRQIARLLRAFGLAVAGVGRRARSRDPDFGVVHAASGLRTALEDADFVVCVVPSTPATRRMFGAAEFAAMKPTARFINLARGTVVDEAALAEACRSRRIAGAALDVFETEPLPAESELWAMDNVIVSPHMSGDFVGHNLRMAQAFIENLQRYRSGEPLANVVDKSLGFVASSA
jgi:phosphoglycerate dehydrogenase-like enzyme